MRRALFVLPFVTMGLAALPANAADRAADRATDRTDDGQVICECPVPSATTPPAPTTRAAPLPPAETPRRRSTEEYQDHGSPRPFGPPATVEPSTPGLPVPNY